MPYFHFERPKYKSIAPGYEGICTPVWRPKAGNTGFFRLLRPHWLFRFVKTGEEFHGCITKAGIVVGTEIRLTRHLKDVLTDEQVEQAKKWLREHEKHIYSMMNEPNTSMYPPSEWEDKNNPALWKPAYWLWFYNQIMEF